MKPGRKVSELRWLPAVIIQLCYTATTEDISGLADSHSTANTTCPGEVYLDALCTSHSQAAKNLIASDNSFPF